MFTFSSHLIGIIASSGPFLTILLHLDNILDFFCQEWGPKYGGIGKNNQIKPNSVNRSTNIIPC